MTKLIISGLLAGLLAACGGGGGGSSATPVTSPTSPPITAPVDSPVSAPPLTAQAVTLASSSNNVTTDSMNMLIKSSGSTNLTLSGKNNNVWINEGQAVGTVSITGTSNTIVFMAGATVTSLTVGAGNTVYLPLGSAIKVEGTGATVKYYTK